MHGMLTFLWLFGIALGFGGNELWRAYEAEQQPAETQESAPGENATTLTAEHALEVTVFDAAESAPTGSDVTIYVLSIEGRAKPNHDKLLKLGLRRQGMVGELVRFSPLTPGSYWVGAGSESEIHTSGSFKLHGRKREVKLTLPAQ